VTLARTPLAPLAFAFGIGIVLASRIEPVLLWPSWLAALAIGAGLLTLGQARGASVALLVAVALLGALRGIEQPLPPDHIARFSLPGVARVEGRLAAEPTRWAPDRTRLLIDAERADGTPASGRIQATVYGVSPMLTEGQHLAGLLRLRPATGFHNPGTFDYGEHLARQGIRIVATGRAESIEILDDPAPPWPVRVRRAAIASMGTALPPVSAALLAGLLLGDRTDLPRDVDEAFRLAGVYHVLAVSGFNVAILAASVWAVCRFLRVPRRAGAATAIVIVIGFALVVGPSPSVLRAVVMAVLVLTALLLERDASVTNSLALAALAILAVRPGDVFDPGFQLSFAATLGIVVAPLPRGMIVGALAVSTAAQLAVLPVALTHFNQLSTIGVVANLGVVPLAAAATVVGLAAVGLSFLSEAIGAVAFDAVWPSCWRCVASSPLPRGYPRPSSTCPLRGRSPSSATSAGSRFCSCMAALPRHAAVLSAGSWLSGSSASRSGSPCGRSCDGPMGGFGSPCSTSVKATPWSSRCRTAVRSSSTPAREARRGWTSASASSRRFSGTAPFSGLPASP
jgi:competence protein ComEC